MRRTELAAATDAASKKPPRLRKSKASAQRDEQAKDVQEAEEIMASKRDVLDHLVVCLSIGVRNLIVEHGCLTDGDVVVAVVVSM